MPSEERREIAARLRKCGAELSIIGADCETAFHVIDEVIGCREVDSWDGFLGRLADLIDPTCHVVGTDSQEWRDGTTVFTHELSCGHTCETSWPEPPEYCEICGARCVPTIEHTSDGDTASCPDCGEVVSGDGEEG